MPNLNMLTICLCIGAFVWIAGNNSASAGVLDDKYPPEQLKIINHILAAKKPEERSDARKGYRQLFSKVDAAGLQRLQSYPDDNIALQAAWQEVELTIPVGKQLDQVRPDRKKLEWFLSFMEQRCKLKTPEWWKATVLEAIANQRYDLFLHRAKGHPYHDAGVDRVRAPRDTTLRRTHDKLTLHIGTDFLVIPEELFRKLIQGEYGSDFSALFTPTSCYVVVHDDFGSPCKMTCLDRATAQVKWRTDIWGSWWLSIAGEGAAYVTVTEQADRIIVFGTAPYGFHVEAFNAADGKNLFRVTNRYVTSE